MRRQRLPERGIHAVGVDLVAAEAGVTKKTLYDRFGSKEQIVVEYLAGRDERWRDVLARRLDAAAGQGPVSRVLAVFEASRAWAAEYGSKGCSMINAHAEIGDPAHPAYPVIVAQKAWMLDLFTRLARETGTGDADRLGRALMLLHEGALVTHGLGVFPDPLRSGPRPGARPARKRGGGGPEHTTTVSPCRQEPRSSSSTCRTPPSPWPTGRPRRSPRSPD